MNWIEPGERRYFGIDFVNEAEEQVRVIQQHMKAAQSRQKSYADRRRRPLTFEVGDYILESITHERGEEIWDEKEAFTKICGTIQDCGTERECCL